MQIKLTFFIMLLLSTPLYAAVDELLAEYRAEGVTTFSAKAGKTLWSQEFTDTKT